MNSRYLRVAAAAIALMFCGSVAAIAAPGHHKYSHIRVDARIDPSCVNFTVGNIYFGQLSAFPPYSVVTSNDSVISYKCTLGTNVELTGHGDCTNPSDSDTNWAMCDGHGHYVDYAMYMAGSWVVEGGGTCGPSTSPQEQQNVPFTNDETDFPYIDAGSGYTDATQDLCAQIPTDPSPATGAIYVGSHTNHYSDHVTLTLSY